MLETGQPLMSSGLYNQILISLFTKDDPPWAGNLFLSADQRIGSDFEDTCRQPITVRALANVENSAERAVKSHLTPVVRADVKNSTGDVLDVTVRIGDIGTVALRRDSAVWTAQRAMGEIV